MATKKTAQTDVQKLLARLDGDPEALELVERLIEALAARNQKRRRAS